MGLNSSKSEKVFDNQESERMKNKSAQGNNEKFNSEKDFNSIKNILEKNKNFIITENIDKFGIHYNFKNEESNTFRKEKSQIFNVIDLLAKEDNDNGNLKDDEKNDDKSSSNQFSLDSKLIYYCNLLGDFDNSNVIECEKIINFCIFNFKKEIMNCKSLSDVMLIFSMLFNEIHNILVDLKTYSTVGLTIIVLLFINEKLYTVNVGDNRSLLFKSFDCYRKQIIQLCQEHVICNLYEAERLTKFNPIFFVDPPFNDEVCRVYPHKGRKIFSDDIVTRCIGFTISSKFGVTFQPDITEIDLIINKKNKEIGKKEEMNENEDKIDTVKSEKNENKFILIGSYSIFWAFTNLELVDLINQSYLKNQYKREETIVDLMDFIHSYILEIENDSNKNTNNLVKKMIKETSHLKKTLKMNIKEFTNLQKAYEDNKTIKDSNDIKCPELGLICIYL